MNTTEESQEIGVTIEMPHEESGHVQIAITSATLVFSTCTVIINPLTLLAMGMHGIIRKNSINMHIASLCLSDFLLGLSAIPFMLLRLVQVSHQGIIAITWAASFLFSTGFLMSSANAFLIGVDRACATLAAHSNKSRMTTRRATIGLIAVWSSVIVAVTACGFVTAQHNDGLDILFYVDEILPADFISYFGAPLLSVITAVVALLYTVIAVAFYKSAKKVHPSSTFEIRNRRMTRTVTIVIGMLLLSYIPVIIVATMPRNVGSGGWRAIGRKVITPVS
ncbi:hypothetical protein CAPTEDRAFT_195567 [Capitella teleta]|uniref:G-protein coupled receptors family 1 profile domain-containing protein n=1 Tax=Capitella teleta TaxID=283909 RepID=R7U4Y8_CAPTE|nr:hypothetical protein CAPTEDRAFT_195567 [Capitella teleta]|eukprot:ELU01014.1 hypothetical protein CAPTEDRAFT_195567 [Capitella teleta]